MPDPEAEDPWTYQVGHGVEAARVVLVRVLCGYLVEARPARSCSSQARAGASAGQSSSGSRHSCRALGRCSRGRRGELGLGAQRGEGAGQGGEGRYLRAAQHVSALGARCGVDLVVGDPRLAHLWTKRERLPTGSLSLSCRKSSARRVSSLRAASRRGPRAGVGDGDPFGADVPPGGLCGGLPRVQVCASLEAGFPAAALVACGVSVGNDHVGGLRPFGPRSVR